MGKIDKALQRVKNQDNARKRGGQSAPSGELRRRPGNSFAAKDDVLVASARKIHLDADLLAEKRIITKAMDPAILTSYKMLRTRLLQRMRTNGWQSLAVTSATQGDGKTVTAINLAISLAGDVNHNVCLVDLDLRHSSVAGYLGIESEHGISDCLHGKLSVSEVALKPNIDRLIVVPNCTTESHSSEMLSSPAMHDIATELARDPDRIVVYDMPPVLAADDMLAFAPNVDAVLFIATERQTARTDVKKAHELLENIEIIGTVLNRSDEQAAAYY